MAQKYKRTKIKRSKGRLYKKRKSTARKVGEGVLLFVIVAALGFLGYCVAGPVINYFRNNSGSPEVTEWTPEPTDVTTDSTDAVTETTTTEATTAPPEEPENTAAAVLAQSDLADIESYKAALKEAADSGADKVYIPIKDENGVLLYKTSVDGLAGSDVDGGTIPCAQLTVLAKSEGLEPAAVMPTLRDNQTPGVWNDTSYRFADGSYAWLDGRVEEGGKRWLDPFRSGTLDYFTALSTELCRAGFVEILLTDTIFPHFMPYDEQILASHFFTSDRYSVLGDVVEAVSSSGATVRIQADLSDIVASFGSDFTGTAEVLKNTNLHSEAVLNVVFTNSDFKNKLPISDTQSVELSADITKRIKTLYETAQKYLPEYTIVPVINSDGLSAEDIEKAKTALTDMGYTEIIVK